MIAEVLVLSMRLLASPANLLRAPFYAPRLEDSISEGSGVRGSTNLHVESTSIVQLIIERVLFSVLRPLRWHYLAAFAVLVALSTVVPAGRAEAACSVPNSISNGQVADATAVMDNFNALTNCVNGVVSPTGSPTTGSLSAFASPTTVTTGNLSGDCTTAGSLAVTCTKSNGIPFSSFATGTDAAQLTGTISVSRFANGLNADGTHFLRGDGTWAQPPVGSGGGGGGILPTFRGSSKATASASSVLLTFPTGVTVGDDCYLFVSAGSVPIPPSGWAMISPQSGYGQSAWIGHKTLDSTDISAGNVTISVSASFRVQAMAACFAGAANHVSWVDNRVVANGLGTSWLQNRKWRSPYAHATETVFVFLANRASSSNTSSVGTLLQSDVEGDGSAQLYSLTPSTDGAVETSINFPTIGSFDLMLFMVGITQ